MLNKFKCISGSILKLIAITSMIIDHANKVVFRGIGIFHTNLFAGITPCWIFGKIGRLAFPIFCFLIAEGMFYSKRKKKYLFNLLLFAVISEIPFNLMHGSFLYGKQNVFFTLFLGALAIYIIQNVKKEWVMLVSLLAVFLVGAYSRIDYGMPGVAIIVLLYVLREKAAVKSVAMLPLLSGGPAAWSSIILLNMYNGERGFIKGKFFKYFFYAIYPLHIIILVLIRKFLM